MPFLFPALASFVCDIGIIYLGRRSFLREQIYQSTDAAFSDNYDEDDETSMRVYHYGYIICLAAIRLFLLLIPLPYHSFFGKALRPSILYRLFYGATLMVVSIHALTLIMVDPKSLSSLLKAIASYSKDGNNSRSIHHILVTRSLWVSLILTLVSTLNHIALCYHVRSTAPRDSDFFLGRRKPKVLLYYAKEKNQLDNSHSDGNFNGQSEENYERECLLNGADGSGPMTIGLPMGGFSENHIGRNSPRHLSSRSALNEMSNKLMMEIQVRLGKAKSAWTKRLEDYQKPLRAAAAVSNSDRQSHQHNTPFRVILELFAGDHNFNHTNNDNGSIKKLDAVYDLDDGAALMLFVPQLLSFFLHGAYESSYQLEEWILETCQKNLFFAHKCYWFLRAWSLETCSATLIGAEVDQQFLRSHQQPVTRLSHSSSLVSFATQEEESNNGSKLLPEERAVIEDLMRKIMTCGEEPARLLHFGPTTFGKLHLESASKRTTSSASSSMTSFSNGSNNHEHVPASFTPSSASDSGIIPIDPLTNVPSRKHFDCLVANRTHGFLPLDNGAVLAASYNQSILNGNRCGTSYFDSCPVFMDALITIADNLFKVPRESRKAEFKKQLQLLEVQALPCNEIYIPLQNLHHRVWRIVAEESIPLSTKERVPCIVCLEVLGYTPEQSCDRDIGKLLKRRNLTGSHMRAAPCERELVDNWRNSPRNPYRRETALNRMGHRMGKLPDKMIVSMQEMQSSMQEMQEQIKHSISTHMRDAADGMNHNEFWLVTETTEINGNGSDNSKETKSFPENLGSDTEEGNTLLPQTSTPTTMTTQPSPADVLTPPRTTQPLSPMPQRSSMNQGKMGQWTKSPAPPGYLASSSSPSRLTKISDSVVEDLSAPTMQAKYESYQTVDNNGGSIGSRSNFAQGRNLSLSLRKQLEVQTNGSDIYDDDENDCSEHDTNGNVNHRITPTSNGNPKPPPSSTRPPPVVFKENWKEKEERLRSASAYGNHPGWKLLPVLVKSNDDLRQEQLASQLIQRMALILARDKVSVWLCPYEILALDASGGIIEAIPDTISLASLKKNDPDYTDLKGFFEQYFHEADTLADAKANFCESLAAYSMVCFLLQIKDRHNGNILLDNRGHLIHIDFGFFFLSSPGKNTGFESAPFKLTREFVDLLGGPDSHLFGIFRTLCHRTFLSLRKHCHEIILLVEMLQLGNEELACFRGRPDDAIRELRQRFRLDLNDRACLEYVNALIEESLENWRTNWYDRYQRYCVGVL